MRYVVPDLDAIAGGYPGTESVLVMDYRELSGFFKCGRLKFRCHYETAFFLSTKDDQKYKSTIVKEVVALKEYTPGWINEEHWLEIPKNFSDVIKWVKTCN